MFNHKNREIFLSFVIYRKKLPSLNDKTDSSNYYNSKFIIRNTLQIVLMLLGDDKCEWNKTSTTIPRRSNDNKNFFNVFSLELYNESFHNLNLFVTHTIATIPKTAWNKIWFT